MSSGKRSQTIEYFFNKKQRSNSDVLVATTSDNSSHLIRLENIDSVNRVALTTDSQAPITLNDCGDTSAVLTCIEDIILSIESGDGSIFLPSNGRIRFFCLNFAFYQLLFILIRIKSF